MLKTKHFFTHFFLNLLSSIFFYVRIFQIHKEALMKKRPFFKDLDKIIFSIAHISELFMSCMITLVIIILMAKMLFLLPSSNVFILADEEAFSEFLSKALNLVVGVEFVKMLCKHTPETVIEVLLFATARQMIVEHLAVHQILIGTLAIAVLFATRKFLLSSPAEKSTSIPSMKKSEHT